MHRRNLSAFLIATLVALWGCTPQPATSETPFSILVEDGGFAPWTLQVETNDPQPTLFFSRSRGDYRIGNFESESDGIAFRRVGEFDTIVMPPGASEAVLRFTPSTKTIRGDYTPFLPFSDGGLAVYLGQFELLRAQNPLEVAGLNGDINAWSGEQFDIPLTLRSTRPILLDGEVHSGDVQTTIMGGGSYAYLGDAEIVQGESFSGVLDPGLPGWLVDGLDSDLLRIFTELEDRFGFDLPKKASVLFAFRGYETPGLSNTGGVIGDQMILETSGSALKTPNPEIKSYFQWFFAHEAVHIFQGVSGVRYDHAGLSWISEGSANAMANQLLLEAGLAPAESIQDNYRQSYRRCILALDGRTLEQAIEKGPAGNYDCGDFIARISDAALPAHSLPDLWAAMAAEVTAAPGNTTDEYDAGHYFAALSSLGASPETVAQLRAFTQDVVPDADAALREMMTGVGIDASFENGLLTGIVFPE